MRGSPRSPFRKALEASFATHGQRAMEVCWIEHPLEMLRLCGSLEPKTMKYEGAERGMNS
jgi:hypothetical protein